jgi:hypothetical protein
MRRMVRALGKLLTLALIIGAMLWIIEATSSRPPTSTRSGTIDLSEVGSSAAIQPDGTRPFLITIVPIGEWPFLLGAPVPDQDLRLRVTAGSMTFSADRRLMTASALHDGKLTIMLWNQSYGTWFAGGPVTVTVERASRAYGKAMAWRLVEGGELQVEQ